MTNRRLALATAALLLVGLACGGMATPTVAPEAPTPVTAYPEAPAPTATSEMATLTLYNHSDRTICYVYIVTLAGDYEWLDRLGPTEVVPPGARRVFSIEPGRYDMGAQDCEHRYIDARYGVDLSGKVDWFVSGDAP